MLAHLLIKRSLILSIIPFSLGACEGEGLFEPQEELELTIAEAPHLQALPFHGNTTGRLAGPPAPAPEGRCPAERPILALYQGAGTATHLGQFTVFGGECMNPAPTSPVGVTGEGRYRLTAANGDWMDVAYDIPEIRFDAPPSPWIFWSATVRVVEGSGRFLGAEFIDVTWAGGYNAATHETYSTLDGKIRYNASVRVR
jgi:hypothetical protein